MLKYLQNESEWIRFATKFIKYIYIMRKMVLFSAVVLATGVAMAANPTKVTETRMSSAGLRAERMNQQFLIKQQ